MKTTQEQDRAILQVSYLLATLDGNVSDEEKKLFRKIGGAYSWFTPGNQKTNDLIDDVVSSSEKLLRLKGFYNEQEFLTAFLTETENDCKTIKSSNIAARKAFAIWIAMCLADKDFSAIERIAIKLLQQSFNSKQGFDILINMTPILVPGTGTKISTATGLVTGGVLGGFAGYFVEKAIDKKLNGKAEVPNVGIVISDDFLKATEDDCVTLGNLLEQIELAKTPTEKAKLENAYKAIESGLHARIVGNEDDSEN